MTDAQLAAALAEAAGRKALEMRSTGLKGALLGAAGDAATNTLILAGLTRERPGDAILSEESTDTAERLAAERVWIVDPLDGTREYAEGRDDWAVHVALVEHGVPVVGAVALPAQGLLLRSDAPLRPPARAPGPLRMVLSRTRPPDEGAGVARLLGAERIAMGSAGAKAAAVLGGLADIYLHCGGQHEWDNCAPAAVALAAGFSATRLDGSPLRYNRADTLVPDLLICAPELFPRVQEALAGC